MAGGLRSGGRITLLPLILHFEEDVEADLAFIGIDYRDWYKPGGGDSRLTTRRLLLLVDKMDRMKSHFWGQVQDTDPLSSEAYILSSIFSALSDGSQHPLTQQKKKREEIKRQEARAQNIRKAMLQRRRARALARKQSAGIV